ncbi:serine-rich adhesin for platelets isoform X2 [Ochlerotatus camptorhynchus]|uniref:serine-rich adhesin for platelets isoform X2 n=1 Tax=Ochlerotatus camptorhynchus TaxID=644619 RepID=UPI0031CE1751
MDSMKRSEANSSHHQNKVVLTNQGTDSNSKINCSGSNFNNNTVSNKQQHQTASLNQESTLPNTSTSSTSTTSDIHKDSNFEYDDNEWDVGIGDLIIDLDADIEKSSVNNQQQEIQSGTILIGENSSQPTSEPILPSLPSVGSLDVLGSDSNKASLKKSQNALSSPIPSKDCDSLGASAVKEDLPPNSAKLLISKATSVKGGTTSSTPSKHHSSSSSSSSSSLPSVTSFASGHHLHHHYHHHHHHHKSNSSVDSRNQHTTNLSKHSVLLSQLNSIRNSNSSPFETSGLKHKHSSSTFSSRLSNMSSTNNSSGGKSATKLAVDHQATLDKGLKMKIKRTKPGTKTSEAKHEIVKAEQNGTSSLSSSADENNGNSNSSSNSSNKKHSSQSQSQAQVASSTIQQQSQQGSKRGSSGHRRDKAKEKTTHHNQREKNEHNSTSTGNSTPSGVDRSCSCTHEIQINGIQQPCSGAFCIKSKTSDQQMTSLTQRLSNQNNSSTSTTNSLFSSNSNTGSSLSSISSSSNTPNAPGPPSSKDNIKISSAAAANNSQLSNLQHSTSSSGSSSGGSGNSNSSNSSSTISSSSGSSSNSANNVLKSQLQSTTPPSSLLNVLASRTLSATESSSYGSASSSTSTSGSLLSSGESSSVLLKDDKTSTSPPPAKRHKFDPKDMVDVCVGTSVGTITEPDCLGPCEPGTSVTLEGIVWHETEGGVLVVNVTWRGKTYVGTLIDCTKHDWAPPRFCDSPTEELDSRTPKGRAKRNRGSALFPVNDLSNFTETRSSMHSKLRNGGTKGRGSRATPTTTADSSSVKTTTTSTSTTGSSSSGTNTSVSLNTPSTSPVAFLPPRPEKRKSKDESPSPVNGGSGSTSSSMSGSVINSSNVNNANMTCMANSTLGTQSVVNPMTGLNVQISTKKCKSTASPCTISPVLLECPEQDCSKKYKHANGLRYHQSHAHGSVSSMDEDSSHPPESPQRVAPPTTPSPLPTVQSTNVLTIPTLTAVSMTTNTSASTTTTSTSSALQATVSVAVTLNASQNATTTTMTTKTTTAATSSTTTNPPCSAPSPSLLMTVNVSSVPVPISTSHSILTTTTSALPVTSAADSQPTATSPSIAGGSITTGVAGQPQPHVMPASSSTLLSSALNGSALSVPISSQLQSGQVQTPSPQQQQSLALQANNNGVATTPTRCDPSAKCKPGILRFGPLHGEVDHNARLTPVAQGSSNIPGTPGSNVSNVQPSTPVRPSNVGVTGGILAMQPATPGTPEGSNMKSQNCSKQKKNRKSPGPSEFDVAAANRAEDVQSPAYSDISDDSAPVVDASDLDKSKGPSLPDVQKKPNEAGQLGPLSGYGMYPYYPAMPHQSSYYSSDHPGKPPGLGHSPLGPNAAVDYKSKEPPLDLMNKPNQHQHQQQQHPPPPQPGQPPHLQLPPGEANAQPNKDCPTGPPAHAGAGKMMQHFYPYGYVRHVFLCKAVTSTFNAYDS